MRQQTRRKTPPARQTGKLKSSKHAPPPGPAQDAAPTQMGPEALRLLDQYRRDMDTASACVKAIYTRRTDSPQAWDAWMRAVSEKYAVGQGYAPRLAAFFPPLPDAEHPYQWDFWRDMELLRGGDRRHLEAAVVFLEADPCFFRSGYEKEDIIPAINRLDLPPKLAGRLQTVVLNIVDRRDGREFRAYCRLARKVDSPELREQLRQRLTRARPSAQSVTDEQPDLLPAIREDRAIRRRARWVLEALGEKDTQG